MDHRLRKTDEKTNVKEDEKSSANRAYYLHHLLIWSMGYRNASLHNTFMVNLYHLPSPWFASLHFDFYERYPRCYHQMTILARYIFKQVSINNVIP